MTLVFLAPLVSLAVMLLVDWLDHLELLASLELRVNLVTLVLTEDPAPLVTLVDPAQWDHPV